MRRLATLAVVTTAALGVILAVRAEAPKNTIKDVMDKAHKKGADGSDPLCKKCMDGKATDDQKKELLALYKDLAANDCPKGDADDWKKRTGDLVAAAEAIINGDKDATAKYKAALNCAACHQQHRGK